MIRRRAASAAAVLLIATAGLSQLREEPYSTRPQPAALAGKTKPPEAATAAKPRRAPAPVHHPAVRQWLRSLTLREKVAQLVIASCFGEAPNTRSKEYRELHKLVSQVRVGGLIVVNRIVNGQVRAAEPFAMAAFLNRMQRAARVPLIVGGDFERGASMRVANTTKFPHAMAFGATGDPQQSRYLGEITAKEARALGVHWVFAPVADVNNNPDNPIINIRSFGEDPKLVASHVAAFIEGAHSDPRNRVLVTAKHFPGHGDTAVDSHLGLASVTADRTRLDNVEFVPFRAAIAAGVDAVMSAHMSAPALGAVDVPATVSPEVLTGVLRKELAFHGLVVTDAMDMQGLTKNFSSGEAAVRALEAGADVLLMPANPEEAIRGVMSAIHQKRLTAKRIEESAARVLEAKVYVGLNRTRRVDPEQIEEQIDSPEVADRAQQIAERAVTLLRNNKDMIPIADPVSACVLVLTESRYSTQGRKLTEEVHARSKKSLVLLLDPAMPQEELDRTAEALVPCRAIYVAAFASVAAYRGNTALAGGFAALLERLTQGSAPVALLSLGNPYLLRNFPNVAAYLTTFSPAPTSETAAVRAIFGEIPIQGRLPVTIPGLANPGDGIQLSSHTEGNQ
jgi:beta-N-acetylhexosaminidase